MTAIYKYYIKHPKQDANAQLLRLQSHSIEQREAPVFEKTCATAKK